MPARSPSTERAALDLLRWQVPVLATLAGAVRVAEPIALRVVVSGALVHGGIALTLRRG